MSVAAFYQCYKNRRAFEHSLAAFRKHYPDSILHIVNDGGDKELEDIASKYNATKYIYSHSIGYLIWPPHDRNIAVNGPYEWLMRIRECVLSLPDDCKYLLNLEDDVFVMNAINTDTLKSDINGCSYHATYRDSRIDSYICSVNPTMFGRKIFYGGSGGCIFNVDFLKKILVDKEKVYKEIEIYCDNGGIEKAQIAADCVLSFLTYINGGTIEQYPGFCETHYADYKQRLEAGNIQVLHKYKEFYDEFYDPV